MKKNSSPSKKTKTNKQTTQAEVDLFIQQNFYNSFFSLYNPKHSKFQIQQLKSEAPKDTTGDNGFSSPLASYLIKEDVDQYKQNREDTFEDFNKLYPKICHEIIDPSNDIPIAFTQKI